MRNASWGLPGGLACHQVACTSARPISAQGLLPTLTAPTDPRRWERPQECVRASPTCVVCMVIDLHCATDHRLPSACSAGGGQSWGLAFWLQAACLRAHMPALYMLCCVFCCTLACPLVVFCCIYGIYSVACAGSASAWVPASWARNL